MRVSNGRREPTPRAAVRRRVIESPHPCRRRDISGASMKRFLSSLAVALALVATSSAQEASWPPQRQKESEFTGRKLDTYRHGVRTEWGYAQPQSDTFLVLHPKEKRDRA